MVATRNVLSTQPLSGEGGYVLLYPYVCIALYVAADSQMPCAAASSAKANRNSAND